MQFMNEHICTTHAPGVVGGVATFNWLSIKSMVPVSIGMLRESFADNLASVW